MNWNLCVYGSSIGNSGNQEFATIKYFEATGAILENTSTEIPVLFHFQITFQIRLIPLPIFRLISKRMDSFLSRITIFWKMKLLNWLMSHRNLKGTTFSFTKVTTNLIAEFISISWNRRILQTENNGNHKITLLHHFDCTE